MTTSTASLEDIAIPGAPGSSPALRGVLGVPAGEGPWPGVVVVHEAFGVDDVMRRQVARLAEAGYLTLMPDLFTAGSTVRCLVATLRAVRAGSGRAFLDVEAARRLLLARPDCTGRLGIIGFCMGGAFALLMAKEYDVSAPNYARLPQDVDEVVRGACPVVASYGGRDGALEGAAAALDAALTTAGVEHDVREYPTAGHSFLNDAPVGPRVLRPLMRVGHVGPDPEAARDAWRRIEGYFDRHLRQ